MKFWYTSYIASILLSTEIVKKHIVLLSTVTLSEHLRSPSVFWWSSCCSSFLFLCVLSYYVSLRSVLCVLMSVTISPLKRCSVHLYLQLFVGGLMSYLRYTCLLACGGVLFVFVFCLVHHMLKVFLDFPFLITPSVFSNVYLPFCLSDNSIL